MRPPTTVGREDLSSLLTGLHVAATVEIAEAWQAGRPTCHATGLASVLLCGDAEARAVVRELTAAGWLLPSWALVPMRWGLDWPTLERDAARPSAEARRHHLDRAVHEWVLDRWRHGHLPSERRPQAMGSALLLSLPGDTRRRHLARLRDPTRLGGAVLAPYGALVPWPAAEVAREALRLRVEALGALP